MTFETFEELEVWKLARQLKKEIRELIKNFLLMRDIDQIIRSSRSIGSNVAEGFGRFHFKDNSKFCLNARGSLFETLNHLIDAFNEEYIFDDELKYFRDKVLHCIKVLNGYIAYLKKQSLT